MRYTNCVTCSKTIGWVGLAVNTVMLFMKAFIGLVGGSQAMLADALYSLKDMVNSLTVIIGTSVSSKPLDAEHPYGHGKVEFILSMVVSVVFIGLTGYLLVHAVQILFDEERHRTPHLIVLWAAIVAVGVNLAMYYYSRCVAIETNSPIVRTMAKHHHGDATASGAVALGIIGAHYLSMPWIDTGVAIWEAIDLLLLSRVIFMDSYRGLMDHSVGDVLCNRIIDAARAVEGVKGVIHLRARYVGQEIWADMIIAVDPEETIERAHDICERARDEVCGKVRLIASLHISAEARDSVDEAPHISNSPLEYDEVMMTRA
ncbi:MAG: magnetosome biogenesis CDF transporter MamM [Alphaproteobacteria bacterium]|nr:magnetosome biogenesis CDF transporter MamM [Alphaproteobacteria bacterium]CAX84223.1 Magnetosome protein MamM [uncultured bacterium]